MLTFLFAALAGAIPIFLFAERLTTRWGAIVFAPLAFLVVLALLFRRAGKRLEPILKDVERHLTAGRRELAIKALEGGMALKRWNPLLPAQIRGQLGLLHYVAGDLDKAEAALRRAGRMPWTSPAYLGCVHFRKNDEKAMRKAFDRSLSFGGKEPVAYALYAYCLRKLGKTKEAIEVLERGIKKTSSKKKPADARLVKNLELLKEGKKMKPQVFGDRWAQFQLEGPTGGAIAATLPRHMRGYATRPGFRNGFRKGSRVR